jgi:hypothetical protein
LDAEHFAVLKSYIQERGTIELCITEVAVNELCFDEPAGYEVACCEAAILKGTGFVLGFFNGRLCMVDVREGPFVNVGEFHWRKYRGLCWFWVFV